MTVGLPAHAASGNDVAAAFDALAPRYDALWTHSLLGSLQRRAVWREMTGLFHPGERILDLGCGTGADTIHLAHSGLRVHSIDVSEAMVRIAQARVQSEGLSDLVTCELRALEDLRWLEMPGPYDGAISNFGVLNCVQDLRPVATALGSLLRPGGRLVLCWLGRFCLWETSWYLLHAQPSKAFRRMCDVRVSFGSNRAFPVFYPTVKKVVSAFRQDFRVLSCRGIGVLLPPSYMEQVAGAAPRFFRKIARLDYRLGGWPLLRSAADHRLWILIRN